jgi:hypothetical protein
MFCQGFGREGLENRLRLNERLGPAHLRVQLVQEENSKGDVLLGRELRNLGKRGFEYGRRLCTFGPAGLPTLPMTSVAKSFVRSGGLMDEDPTAC